MVSKFIKIALLVLDVDPLKPIFIEGDITISPSFDENPSKGLFSITHTR